MKYEVIILNRKFLKHLYDTQNLQGHVKKIDFNIPEFLNIPIRNSKRLDYKILLRC